MSYNRRKFLQTGSRLAATGAVLATVPRSLAARVGARTSQHVPPIQDPLVKIFAQRGVDAARSAGASYADVRLVHSRTRSFGSGVEDAEVMNIGVRAFVKGYWGFASSSVWHADEVVRLAQKSTQTAMSHARGKSRPAELVPIAPVHDQHWTMPVVVDPFNLHPDEILDYLRGLNHYAIHRVSAAKLQLDSMTSNSVFSVIEKAIASTDDTYCTQRLYRSHGNLSMSVSVGKRGADNVSLMSLTPAGVGWELYRDQPLRDEIDRVLVEAREYIELPARLIDVGRYDIVMDAWSLAHIVSPTIGLATELDRALGYEANAGGTSYLAAPQDMVGTFKVGAPLLNVIGNRSTPGGVSTVQWDDEAVPPVTFPIVRDGVLTDYSTTREGAGWLRDIYARDGRDARSNGCAVGGEDFIGGMHVPLAQTPNLMVAHGPDNTDFDSSVAALSKGIAWTRMACDMDFQQLNGLANGKAYEIRNGVRVAKLMGAGILFRAPEFLKNLIRLGGQGSARRYGMRQMKGEPPQLAHHSVSAVPATFKDISVIDMMRKA